MRGTLNGIHLDQITSITTEPAGNSTLTTIRGIEACSEDDEIPFENILDRLTGSDPSVTDYVLEGPARCLQLERRLTRRLWLSPPKITIEATGIRPPLLRFID